MKTLLKPERKVCSSQTGFNFAEFEHSKKNQL